MCLPLSPRVQVELKLKLPRSSTTWGLKGDSSDGEGGEAAKGASEFVVRFDFWLGLGVVAAGPEREEEGDWLVNLFPGDTGLEFPNLVRTLALAARVVLRHLKRACCLVCWPAHCGLHVLGSPVHKVRVLRRVKRPGAPQPGEDAGAHGVKAPEEDMLLGLLASTLWFTCVGFTRAQVACFKAREKAWSSPTW